jgi:hypothetical protein
MINKIIVTFIVSIFIYQCGFSPIYVGNLKSVVVSKMEIIGDKNLAFDLERRLNFTRDEKSTKAYVFKAQIFDAAENSFVDSRGIATEQIIRLTVTYQFLDKDGTVVYQDSVSKDKRVAVTDNVSSNILVKDNEKKLLLDGIIQNILFKSKLSLN